MKARNSARKAAVQRILQRTVVATLVISAAALAGCSSRGGVRSSDVAVTPPVVDPGLPLNPGGGGNNGGGNNGGGNNGGGDNGGGDNGGGNNGGGTNVTQNALGNLGKAVDNVIPLNLEKTGSQLGETLDSALAPVTGIVTDTTRTVGSVTGLGEPVNGVTQQVGGVVSGLGGELSNSGLPLNLGVGAGGLLSHLGQAVGSAGGLLVNDPDNANPLGNTLQHATKGVEVLTGALLGEGSLLHPLTSQLGLGGALLADSGSPILEPALGNVGQAVDNIVPVGLNPILGDVGAALDNTVAPVAATVTHVTQQVGDGLGVGQPINALLGGVGSVLNQAGGTLDSAAPLGLGGVVGHLGNAVTSAGGLLHASADNANPLGDVLNSTTKAVASLTGGLGGVAGGDNGGLLAPVTGLLGGLAGGDGASGGLLAPVTGLVGGLTGGLAGGDGANDGLLAPVTGLLGGITGSVTVGAGAEAGAQAGGGLLAPVTGLVGGLVGGLTGGVGVQASVNAGAAGEASPAAQANGGLLAPVTGLVGGLLGGGRK
ncbi:collagen-like triple helix repeat-containing protein [Alcaligenes sp. WGS1538]|uniref:collagen-like triple helix repeat-containing protein n=1 Tax=Alcaligenes sp. WGS1538 TaxID=3366811 RepID=UPI00372CFB72